jgi:multicomponent Na+:H+ antiporter subunit C
VNAATLYGLVAAALVAIGLFGVVVQAAVLRKIVAFNLLGGGVFLLFGVIAKRAIGAGEGSDPVPQAMVITGLVVAFAATALAVVMALRMHQITGAATLAAPQDDETQGG